MDYKIVDIDIEDDINSAKVNKFLGEVFGSDTGSLPEHKLKKNTTTRASNKSLYLAAIENDEIIGFNAFISHTLFLNNQSINCYQVCWTSTHNEHRGKKIFQNILEEAKKILQERGASFIFAFPNEISQPIFIHKLGFKEIPSVKLNIPNSALLKALFFNKNIDDIRKLNSNAVLQDEKELYELKRAEYGSDLIESQHNGSMVWGAIKYKNIKGIKISYFDVGGIEIRNTADITELFQKITDSNKFSFFQIVSTKNNSYNQVFKRFKPARTNDLIIFDLNLDTSSFSFNFFGGIKDVW
jgi:predicted N-acetyltransferase YhbS